MLWVRIYMTHITDKSINKVNATTTKLRRNIAFRYRISEQSGTPHHTRKHFIITQLIN